MASDLLQKIKIAAGVAIVIGVIAVLAPPPPSERKYPGRIQVTFWHSLGGEWQPIYEGMVARFNASQTKYEVVPIVVPDDAATMKFLLSASGGSTPDILLDWDPVLGMWSDKELIQPYDGIMTPDEKQKFLSQTYAIVKRHCTYKGKLMAMVDGLDLAAVYYRLDDLKEVGVDKDHLPKTLEELVALGKRLDRYDKEHHLRHIGFLPRNISAWVATFGGQFNKDGHIVVNTPGNLRAMQFISDISKQYGYDAVTRFSSSLPADAGATMPLLAGNYSILFDGEWRVMQAAKYGPQVRYALAPMPAPKGGRANACMSNPNYLMIPTRAKQPKGAWEFAKFCIGFLHPEDGGRNMGDMGWLPDDPLIAKAATYKDYLRRNPNYKVFVDLMSSPNLEIPPQGPLQPFVADLVGKAEDSVLRGTETPEQALKTVERRLAEEHARLKELGQKSGEEGS